MARTPDWRLEGVAFQHFEAFCRAFLLPQFLERKLAKHNEFLNDLCHKAPAMFTPSKVIRIEPPVTIGVLSSIAQLSKRRQATYLSSMSGTKVGEYTIDEALQSARESHSAVISIEPGAFALYVTDGCPKPDWYLLCNDTERLTKAKQVFQQRAKPRQRK